MRMDESGSHSVALFSMPAAGWLQPAVVAGTARGIHAG